MAGEEWTEVDEGVGEAGAGGVEDLVGDWKRGEEDLGG